MGLSAKVLERQEKRRAAEKVVISSDRREAVNIILAFAALFLCGGLLFWRLAKTTPVSAGDKIAVAGPTRDLPPSPVYLNGQRWYVVEYTSLGFEGMVGYTFCDRHIIGYIWEPEKAEVRETIAHELFHAGACNSTQGARYWNSYNLSRHIGIYRLGDFMSTTLSTNPELAEWFAK